MNCGVLATTTGKQGQRGEILKLLLLNSSMTIQSEFAIVPTGDSADASLKRARSCVRGRGKYERWCDRHFFLFQRTSKHQFRDVDTNYIVLHNNKRSQCFKRSHSF